MTQGSVIDKDTARSKKMITAEVELGGNSVTGVSHNYKDKSIRSLCTSKALWDVYILLTRMIEGIVGDTSVYQDTSALTPNLMSPTMEEKNDDIPNGYVISGWEQNGTYRMTNRFIEGFEGNFIKIPNGMITAVGVYMDLMTVTNIVDGEIRVMNTNGEIINTIKEVGDHVTEIHVTNMTTEEIYIRFHPYNQDATATISKNGFHYVTDRLYQYMYFLFDKMLEDFSDSGYVTQDGLDQIVTQINQNIQTIIEQFAQTVAQSLEEHLQADNPHGIDPDEIGAARKNHGHEPADIGAADRDHSHTAQDIGAAERDHSHSASDVGAAPANHSHSQYMLKTDIVIPKVYKPSVVLDAPVGTLPSAFIHTQVNLPVVSIQGEHLTHTADGVFDTHSGVISSNRESATPLYEAVKFGKVTTFAEDEGGVFASTGINYKLHYPRDIGSIQLRKDPTIVSYPTQVALYVNDNLVKTMQCSWIGDVCELPIGATIHGANKIGLIVQSIVSQANWSFGMDFDFIDLADQMFFVTPGVSCTFEQEDIATVSKELVNKIPFDIPDMVIDHPYFIGLKNDESAEDGVSVHVVDLPPEYGVTDKGTRPFLSNYVDGPSHEFYGDIIANSEDGSAPVQNVYNIDNGSYKSSMGTTNVTIQHDFPEDREVHSIEIAFKKSEFDMIPKTMLLDITLQTGNMLQILNVPEYLPDINNDDDTYVSITIDVGRVIKAFRFTLSDPTANQVAVALIKVSLVSEFYNIHKLLWADGGQRNFIGVIYKRGEGQFDIRPYAIGGTTCLPINGLNKTSVNGIYEVVNPFGSRNISAKLIALAESDDIIPPTAQVLGITNDKITVEAITADVFAIDLDRDW